MKKYLRLDVYVPSSHLEKLKEALFAAGAGKLGNYDRCCWQTQGLGQFRPLTGSSPFLGDEMKLEVLEEYKLEILFPVELKQQLVTVLRETHPYEEPAFQIIEVSIS